MVDVSIIIITYNIEDLIYRCIESIYKTTGKRSFEIIIVDNNSTDKTVKIIKDNFKNVILIESKENLGFAKANNLASKYARGKYLFFLNPDTELKSNVIDRAVDFFETSDDVSIIGSKLLWPSGEYQDSYKRFFGPLSAIMELVEIHFYFKNNIVNRKINYDFVVFDKPTEVEWVIGAAFFIRKSDFEEAGGFDENFFMYAEEIDLCRRIRGLNKKIYFHPDLVVVHYKGQSSKKTSVRSIDYYKSLYYYLSKYYGRVSASIYRFFLILWNLFYISVVLFKFLLNIKKEEQLIKMKNKLKLLKWSSGL